MRAQSSVGPLVRTRETAVWLVLVCATLVSWATGGGHGITDHRIGTAVIFVVAFTKVRLVGLYFMELRAAPVALRLVFEAYCVLVLSAVLVMYLVS